MELLGALIWKLMGESSLELLGNPLGASEGPALVVVLELPWFGVAS